MSACYLSALSRNAFRALHAYRPTNRDPDPIGGSDTHASFATVLQLHHHLTIKNGVGLCPSLLGGPRVSEHLGGGIQHRARPRAGERRLHTVANLYAATESQRGDSEVSQGA
jgi:hypothetical protein